MYTKNNNYKKIRDIRFTEFIKYLFSGVGVLGIKIETSRTIPFRIIPKSTGSEGRFLEYYWLNKIFHFRLI